MIRFEMDKDIAKFMSSKINRELVAKNLWIVPHWTSFFIQSLQRKGIFTFLFPETKRNNDRGVGQKKMSTG